VRSAQKIVYGYPSPTAPDHPIVVESDSGYTEINPYEFQIFNYKIPSSPNDQNAYAFYSKIS
jgi:hypothetical protein